MTEKKSDIITGLLSFTLLISLIVKLTSVPGGLFLSALFIGGMYIAGILIVCLILTRIITLLFKNVPFFTLYFITTTTCFILFHYKLYSPKLTIIAPVGYIGEVNLVLSNVDNNILTLDSNGIGYITEETFDDTYMEPTVIDSNGEQLNSNCVGFNPSTFWGQGSSSDGKTKIKTLSFEIVSSNKIGQKQYHHTDLFKSVDITKLK